MVFDGGEGDHLGGHRASMEGDGGESGKDGVGGLVPRSTKNQTDPLGRRWKGWQGARRGWRGMSTAQGARISGLPTLSNGERRRRRSCSPGADLYLPSARFGGAGARTCHGWKGAKPWKGARLQGWKGAQGRRHRWKGRRHVCGCVICGRDSCARLRPRGRRRGLRAEESRAEEGIARWQNRASVHAYTKNIRNSRD